MNMFFVVDNITVYIDSHNILLHTINYHFWGVEYVERLFQKDIWDLSQCCTSYDSIHCPINLWNITTPDLEVVLLSE